MDIFLQSEGIGLSWEGGHLVVLKEGTRTPINLHKINRLWIQKDLMLSTLLLSKISEAGVEIVLSNQDGSATCTINALDWGNKIPLRKRQLLFSNSAAAQELAMQWIWEKQAGQMKLLNLHFSTDAIDPIQLIWKQNQPFLGSKSNFDLKEAHFAKIYFQIIRNHLPDWMKFKKRTRNPATDVFSACLNHSYSLLYPVIQGVLLQKGLDPYIGIYHKERKGNAVLTFDLIEPFRPLAESIVLELVYNKTIQATSFTKNKLAIRLDKSVRKNITEELMKRFYQSDTDDESHPNLANLYRKVNQLYEIITQFS